MESVHLNLGQAFNFKPIYEYGFNNLYSKLELKFKGKNKFLIPFVVHYLVSTKNFDIVNKENLENFAKNLFVDLKNDAKKSVLKLLKEFESYDKERLIILVSNQFQLTSQQINNLFEELATQKKITIKEKTIDFLK